MHSSSGEAVIMCGAECTIASEEGAIMCSAECTLAWREAAIQCSSTCTALSRDDTRWNYEDVEDLIESIPHYDQMINSIQVMM